MLLSIFGGFLETLVIILVGYRLIGISLKDKMIPICIVSFYGSIILLMVKETLPSITYLLVTILAIGFLLTFVTNLNSFASIIAVLLGCLLLLISEVIGFALFKEFPYIHSLSALPLVRAIPHLVIMVIFYVILRTANYYIPIPVKKKQNKNDTILSVLVFLFGLLFLFYIFVFEFKQLKFLSITSAIVLVLITISLLYIIRYHMVKKIEDLAVSLDGQYEEDISKHITTMRSQRHDFIHHILALKQMLNSGKYNDSVDYVNSVLEEISYVSDILPIASEAVGGLLLSYKEKGSKKGINMYYYIADDLSSFPCKVYETNKIFGNLILNAIEAVDQLEEEKRYINMKIQRNDVHYILEVSNFIEGGTLENIGSIFDQGFTTKKNACNTGQGLAIVESLVMQYGGHIYPEVIDDMITFIVKIPHGGQYV
ncbi:GHKL domain-containing protein [Peribacillus sp. NJ11]|uniref:sensor histidine kinase n=1 Tax=Peribacillus sp. NJ11 TaxID=3055861 RepID=UPI0025A28CD9|nr:GHKL domain-containing protein [Peribacillus sp. NJ11]MDM5220324.1 GHKL domain-containing protein [Peribacillus sp. NJ11]